MHITPFLLDAAPDALEYTRALIDFITLAQYRFHDESTLSYMEQALVRIDNTKEAFAKYRPTDINGDAQWNYPKFHSLSHYVSFIRKFGAPNGYDTEHMEPGHKFLVKDFYSRTNKNHGYLRQIASHNTRDTNRKAMDHNLLQFFSTTDQEGVKAEIQVTSMSNTPLPVKKYGCNALPAKTAMSLRLLRLDPQTTTTASEAALATGFKGFPRRLEGITSNTPKSRTQGPQNLDVHRQHLSHKVLKGQRSRIISMGVSQLPRRFSNSRHQGEVVPRPHWHWGQRGGRCFGGYSSKPRSPQAML
jgi:hypothetical protein